MGRDDGRRQQRGQQRPGRQGHVQHGRGRETVRHLRSAGPSGCGTARRRSWTSRWTSSTTRWSCARARASCPVADRASASPPPSAAGTPGRHGQPDQQHAAAAAARPGHRRWARTARRTPTASSSRPAPRHLPRAGQAHDRHQVQRPRPRPGRRRGRGQARRPRTSSRPPTGRSGAASSSRWRTPRAGLMFIIPLSLGLIFILLYIGLPLVPGRDRGLQQRLRPGGGRHLGACT